MTISAPPALDSVMTIEVRVGSPFDLGKTGSGVRRIIPLLGGEFHGEGLSGKVIEGGADWQIVRDDGVATLDVRYTLRTDDGQLIAVYSRGMRRASPAVLKRLAAGEKVDPSEYYFRAAPIFETSAPAYAFLEQYLFVANCHRHGDRVTTVVWKVL
jgi:hypothetical protein